MCIIIPQNAVSIHFGHSNYEFLGSQSAALEMQNEGCFH